MQTESENFEKLFNDIKNIIESSRKKAIDDIEKSVKKVGIQPTTKNILKDPQILKFLGLEQKAQYNTNNKKNFLLYTIKEFLLEIDRGFGYIATRESIFIENKPYCIDLVFYNRLLQCHVLFEIKTHRLTHQDMGQLQMYVNYYDREIKLEHESPTIGVLLCADKNDSVVKYSLPKDNETILASKYELYLPSEEEFKKLLEERSFDD